MSTIRSAIFAMVAMLSGTLVSGCQHQGAAKTADSSTMGLDVKIAPFVVPPGTEVQNCFYLKVPSDTDLDLGRVVIDFAQGTHHMHVYYGDEQHADGVEECFTAVDFDKWHLLVGSQKPHLEWELPPNVAFHVKAHQQLLVQVHFVNASMLSTTDNMATGTIHFDTRAPGEVTSYMGSIFGQQRAIDVKPHATQSVDGICRLPHDLSLGALAGHYHFKSQDFTASRMHDDATTDDAFYATSYFAEPKFQIYGEDAPLRFGAGERILWHCDYVNESDTEIPFGPMELTQEHCNMFAFYYPAAGQQEFTPCVSYGRCPAPCAAGESCTEQGECKKACTPSCGDKQCGDDGCGGSCGSCPSASICSAAGQCERQCTPSCDGRQCGDDGCGGSCGSCGDGQQCTGGACGAVGCDANGGVEVEPNDRSSAPTVLCTSGVIQGTIATANDIDWYSFTLQPGDHYSVALSALPADYTLTVYHLAASGSLSKIGDAVDNHDLADQVFRSYSINGGTYLVKVHSAAGASDVGRRYTLTEVTL